jgi:hypothetical protein
MDNISALREITPEVASAPVHLFDVAPTIRRLRGNRGWTRIKSTDVARNPPRGPVIEFYLAQEPAGDVVLTIMDGNGESIRRYSSKGEDLPDLPAAAGMNRFVWDMQYPGTDLPPSAGALPHFESDDHSPPTQPVAPPGQYTVRLTVDDRNFEKTFEILKDPGITASVADLRAQFELMLDIHKRVTDVAEVVMKIRKFRAEIEGRRVALSKESAAEVDTVLRELDSIEGTLTIWMGSVSHPMLFGPPGLIQKLSRLSGAVDSGDTKPTASMYGVFEDLTRRFEDQRHRLNQLMDQSKM